MRCVIKGLHYIWISGAIGTQVQINHGNEPSCVGAIEVLLYVVLWEISLQSLIMFIIDLHEL